MSGYTTIVVGTDGSDSSLRAVEKAGQIAAPAAARSRRLGAQAEPAPPSTEA